jgi:hypothetical protein
MGAPFGKATVPVTKTTRLMAAEVNFMMTIGIKLLSWVLVS